MKIYAILCSNTPLGLGVEQESITLEAFLESYDRIRDKRIWTWLVHPNERVPQIKYENGVPCFDHAVTNDWPIGRHGQSEGKLVSRIEVLGKHPIEFHPGLINICTRASMVLSTKPVKEKSQGDLEKGEQQAAKEAGHSGFCISSI